MGIDDSVSSVYRIKVFQERSQTFYIEKVSIFDQFVFKSRFCFVEDYDLTGPVFYE